MKYFRVLIFIAVAASLTSSQGIFKINYNVGFPNSNMKQFVQETSFSGLSFEYGQYMTRGTYSIGAVFGWNYFSEHDFGTTNFKGETGNISGAVTGSQLKYINAFPMLVNATYYFKPSEQSVVPFVSFGTGTYFITQKYQLGVWEIENDNWHFGIATEAGILFRIENKVGFNTSARLNYAFDSGVSITGSDDNDLSYWTINAGFTVLY